MTICSAARSLGGESWRRHRPIADNAGDKTIHFSNVFISFLLNGPDGNGKEMIFISEKAAFYFHSLALDDQFCLYFETFSISYRENFKLTRFSFFVIYF